MEETGQVRLKVGKLLVVGKAAERIREYGNVLKLEKFLNRSKHYPMMEAIFIKGCSSFKEKKGQSKSKVKIRTMTSTTTEK